MSTESTHPPVRSVRRKPRRNLGQFLRDNAAWIPVAAVLVWTLLPISWSVLASLKEPLEVYQNNILPENPTLNNYVRVLQWPGFWRFSFNSAFLALTSTALAVTLSSLAAYGFARYAFRWRHALLLLILIPRIVPRVSLIVPLYLLFENLGLTNTYAALIITYAATAIPLSTWILVGFFAAVPKELEEAAAIDGATLLQRLYRIVLPLAIPGLLTVAIFSLREAWNEFPFVLALTSSSEMRTLPYQLFLLRDTLGIEDWPLINAFTLLTIIPILLLYMRFERLVVKGLTTGAVK